MATVLTERENDVYVTLLTMGERLGCGGYLKFDEVSPLFKKYDLEEILEKLNAANLLIAKGDDGNKFELIRAVSYENNKVILKKGS